MPRLFGKIIWMEAYYLVDFIYVSEWSNIETYFLIFKGKVLFLLSIFTYILTYINHSCMLTYIPVTIHETYVHIYIQECRIHTIIQQCVFMK